jgi:hypothetical protein
MKKQVSPLGDPIDGLSGLNKIMVHKSMSAESAFMDSDAGNPR